jgi:hypothetical protein
VVARRVKRRVWRVWRVRRGTKRTKVPTGKTKDLETTTARFLREKAQTRDKSAVLFFSAPLPLYL